MVPGLQHEHLCPCFCIYLSAWPHERMTQVTRSHHPREKGCCAMHSDGEQQPLAFGAAFLCPEPTAALLGEWRQLGNSFTGEGRVPNLSRQARQGKEAERPCPQLDPCSARRHGNTGTQQDEFYSLLTSISQGPMERKEDFIARLVGCKSSGKTGSTLASGTISLRSPGQDTSCLCASVSPGRKLFSLHHAWCLTHPHVLAKTSSWFCNPSDNSSEKRSLSRSLHDMPSIRWHLPRLLASTLGASRGHLWPQNQCGVARGLALLGNRLLLLQTQPQQHVTPPHLTPKSQSTPPNHGCCFKHLSRAQFSAKTALALSLAQML